MSVYLNHSYYQEVDDEPKRAPRERFMRYYRDLYQLHQKEMSEETFYMGSQRSYAALGDLVLKQSQIDGSLNDMDVLICPLWAHEFDPDYSSTGAYFANEYHIKQRVFDICDQGTLSPFTAFHILQQFLKTNEYKKGIILGLEQTTIPRNVTDDMVLPSQTGASAIFLEKEFNAQLKHHYQLIYSGIIQEEELIETQFNLKNILEKICVMHSVILSEFQFYSKSNMSSYLINTMQNKIANSTGILPLFAFLHQLIQQGKNFCDAKYICLIDEDVESKDIGIMLIKDENNAS